MSAAATTAAAQATATAPRSGRRCSGGTAFFFETGFCVAPAGPTMPPAAARLPKVLPGEDRGTLPPMAVAVEGRLNCWACATLAAALPVTCGTWVGL